MTSGTNLPVHTAISCCGYKFQYRVENEIGVLMSVGKKTRIILSALRSFEHKFDYFRYT